MKNMIIIGTLFAIQSYASTVRIGFFEVNGLINPNDSMIDLGEAGINADFIHSSSYGLGVRAFFGQQGTIPAPDYVYGLGGHGIKKWTHSPHRRAEIKIGGGWLVYGNAGGGQEFDDSSYSRESLYARLEPSYHFWWKFIGFKTYVVGQISRRGFDYGIGYGFELGWDNE